MNETKRKFLKRSISQSSTKIGKRKNKDDTNYQYLK